MHLKINNDLVVTVLLVLAAGANLLAAHFNRKTEKLLQELHNALKDQ